ncbi:MAG: GNAT family N-acetyltransferase, partial [Abitibacteriaceae bacterium]|nr:GNAT family N-acetyltransferase [Abditibacteriaceae bacterium]
SGWLMAIQEESDHIVGSCMALHNYTQRHPFWGDLGWLACDPQHTGQGLGLVLAAAVTSRFMDAGYTQIELHTEHYRLPAIKTYLKLGYTPCLDHIESHEMWEEVCHALGWDFTPQQWLTFY